MTTDCLYKLYIIQIIFIKDSNKIWKVLQSKQLFYLSIFQIMLINLLLFIKPIRFASINSIKNKA